MKNLLFITFLFFQISLFSQIKFENGYYITNSGSRVDCLIKNKDWKGNPNTILIKKDLSSQVESLTISDIKEFGVIGKSQYVRRQVQIDISSDHLDNLSLQREPKFETKNLFLKTLVSGKAHLFQFTEKDGLSKYFFSLDGGETTQLIYKRYVNEKREIFYNKDFREQIYSQLTCGSKMLEMVRSVEYNSKDLTKVFIGYNTCENVDYNVFKNNNKAQFHLSLRPGLNFYSMEVTTPNEVVYGYIDFGMQTALRVGAELELVLPFNKNKWAVILEPVYASFKSDAVGPLGLYGYYASVNYQYVDINFGVRHKFYLANDALIFANFTYGYVKELGEAKIDFDKRTDIELSQLGNFKFGLGCKFLNKFSGEIQYAFKGQVASDYSNWGADYQGYSIILGYTIF